jgi:acetyltransferase-like isoleucine patch superfamily enzyme
VTGNLRLGEENVRVAVDGQRVDTGRAKVGAMIGSRVRVGINVSLGQPGVRIGTNCAIGPGVLLMRDLPDGQMVTVKQEHEIRATPFEIDRGSRARFHAALQK